MDSIRRQVALLFLAAFVGIRAHAQTPDHTGQVPQPEPLGCLVHRAETVAVLEVQRVDRDKDVVSYKVVTALKGKAGSGLIRHHFFAEDRDFLDWAKPGRRVVCFLFGSKAVSCVGNAWYYHWELGESEQPPVWSAGDWVTGFTAVYVGSIEDLQQHVTAILAGKEVVVTAEVPTDTDSTSRLPNAAWRDWRRGQKGRVWRIKAGPKITVPTRSEHSPQFVGWGIGDPDVVPSLVERLSDKDPLVRAAAAEDLGRLENVGRPALPALQRALRDSDAFVRSSAVIALARIDTETEPELNVLREALRDPDASVRRAGITAIDDLGSRARPAIGNVISILRNDPNALVRRVAAHVLGHTTSSVPPPDRELQEAVAVLANAAEKDEDGAVRLQATAALMHFGSRAGSRLPAHSLRSWDFTHAAMAADTLSRLEPPAVELLVESLQDDQCRARPFVARCLGERGPRASLASPTLRNALATASKDHELELEIVRALVRIEGPTAAPAVMPVIIEEFRQNPDCQSAISTLLVDLGPAALKSLLPMLKEEDPATRLAAASILARLGRQREAVQAILPMVSNGDELAVPAVRALAQMDNEALPAILAGDPALKRAVHQALDTLKQGNGTRREQPPSPERLQLRIAFWRLEEAGRPDNPKRRVIAALDDLISRTQGQQRLSYYPGGELWEPRGAYHPYWGDARLEEAQSVQDSCHALLESLLPVDDPTPVVSKALESKDVFTRLAAFVAWARADPTRADLVPVLLDVLERRPGLFRFVAEPLQAMGARARPAIPWLRRALRSEDHDNYLAAAHVLGHIEPRAIEAVWSARALPAPLLTDAQGDSLWSDLSSMDVLRAFQAQWTLARLGDEAVPLLRSQLHPVPTASAARVDKLIADLDAADFETRTRAFKELQALEEAVEPSLRKALEGKPSVEVRRRVEELIDRLRPERSPERRQSLRALVVLETVGGKDAQAVLQSLARGATEAQVTREAKAVLKRLEKQQGDAENSSKKR
jgi:HEAT repeat protein